MWRTRETLRWPRSSPARATRRSRRSACDRPRRPRRRLRPPPRWPRRHRLHRARRPRDRSRRWLSWSTRSFTSPREALKRRGPGSRFRRRRHGGPAHCVQCARPRWSLPVGEVERALSLRRGAQGRRDARAAPKAEQGVRDRGEGYAAEGFDLRERGVDAPRWWRANPGVAVDVEVSRRGREGPRGLGDAVNSGRDVGHVKALIIQTATPLPDPAVTGEDRAVAGILVKVPTLASAVMVAKNSVPSNTRRYTAYRAAPCESVVGGPDGPSSWSIAVPCTEGPTLDLARPANRACAGHHRSQITPDKPVARAVTGTPPSRNTEDGLARAVGDPAIFDPTSAMAPVCVVSTVAAPPVSGTPLTPS